MTNKDKKHAKMIKKMGKNKCVYEKYRLDTGKVVYVGMGTKKRAYELHRLDPEFNKLVDDGLIGTRIVECNITEEEANNLEYNKIRAYGKDNLFNKINGKSNSKHDIDINIDPDGKVNTEDITTPYTIANEMWNAVLSSKDFNIENKKILETNGRVELFDCLAEKFDIEIFKNNYTMLKNMKGNINGECMNDILILNENFKDFKTKEKYDVIIMNPPFVELGEPFIIKAMDMLNDKGFLGCVMSPTWRSVVTEGGQKNKAYTQMVKTGGFHYIHMYSKKKTIDIFKQPIGQVDVFVWQKGAKARAEMVGKGTEIINIDDEKYYYDLTNYTQTVPFMPSYPYDKLFNQVNGFKWKFGHAPKNDSVKKTTRKKVVVDQNFNKIIVDNIGDSNVFDRYMFFFDTDEERDRIVEALTHMNKYKHLLNTNIGRMTHTFFPGIKK